MQQHHKNCTYIALLGHIDFPLQDYVHPSPHLVYFYASVRMRTAAYGSVFVCVCVCVCMCVLLL